MPTSARGLRGVILLRALILTIVVLPAATARTEWQTAVKQVASSPRSATSPSVARREWDSSRDWLRFTTRIPGDTAVTDNMKALLASGLDPGTQDRYGRTAMHTAALLGQLDLTRFLLARSANVDARDRQGRTPLMISASLGVIDHFSGFTTTSPWALPWTERLCDPDLPESLSGKVRALTSWYDMASLQRPMLRLLLDAGADPAVKDFEGHDALDYAAQGGPTGFDRLLPAKAAGGEQSGCDLDLARSPEVRGLHLGMGLREAATRLRPLALPEADWCGRQTLEFDWADDLLGQRAPVPKEFAGVRRLMLGFLDGRLAYFRVTYDTRDAPLSAEQFRSTLSSSLALRGRWRRAGKEGLWDHPHAIGCEGFVVIAGFQVGPYVELHDTAAVNVLFRRRTETLQNRLREREAEKERKRKVFKP